MTQAKLRPRARAASIAFLTAVTLGAAAAAFAAPIEFTTGDLKSVLLNPNDTRTGVRIDYQSGQGGQVDLQQKSIANEPLLSNLQTPAGFRLLDTTLFVDSTLTTGVRRIRARIGYRRADVRALGIRANSLRLLRADIAGGRWLRAVSRIRDQGRATIRYLPATVANLRLGNHGFDATNKSVWAVTDLRGSQYFAIGGPSAIPLPAAWILFLSGSGLLLMLNRRRGLPGR